MGSGKSQSTLNKLGESQLEFTNRLAAKEAAVAEFEASVSEKMTTVKSLELALQVEHLESTLIAPAVKPSVGDVRIVDKRNARGLGKIRLCLGEERRD
jgi:hypothetical protein